MSFHISAFPAELLVKIFSECDSKDQGAIAQVCQLWHRLSMTDDVWRSIAERKFGISSAGLEGARAICLSKVFSWKPVQRHELPLEFWSLREWSYWPRPEADPPQFVAASPEMTALYDGQTLEQIPGFGYGYCPIGWYGGEFFHYFDGKPVAWNPETKARRTIHLSLPEEVHVHGGGVLPGEHRLQESQLKGGAHSSSYGRQVQAERLAASAPREGAIPREHVPEEKGRVRILHVGLWKGRPSFFYDACPITTDRCYLGVCSMSGEEAEQLCFLTTGQHFDVFTVASSSDGRYFASCERRIDKKLYCFDTEAGCGWSCDVPKKASFAFIGDLLVVGGAEVSVYSAASGQLVVIEEGCFDTSETSGRWEVKSIVTPGGTFLFASQQRQRSGERESDLVLRGLFCRAGKKEAIALRPLIIHAKTPFDIQWDLLPSGNSCRITVSAPGNLAFPDYELPEAWLKAFDLVTPPADDQQSSSRSWPLTVAARVLSTATGILGLSW